jgi:hypothetical protein
MFRYFDHHQAYSIKTLNRAQKKNTLNAKAHNIESYLDFTTIGMLFVYILLIPKFRNQFCRLYTLMSYFPDTDRLIFTFSVTCIVVKSIVTIFNQKMHIHFTSQIYKHVRAFCRFEKWSVCAFSWSNTVSTDSLAYNEARILPFKCHVIHFQYSCSYPTFVLSTATV